MDLGERKETTEVGMSHRHGMSYVSKDEEKQEIEPSPEDLNRSFFYNKNGVKCVIRPLVSNVYGNKNRVAYDVEVSTFANDDEGAYQEGEWYDSSSFENYAAAVEYAMEQVQRRMRVHDEILESLGALSMRLPEVMLEDGHGDEKKYEDEQNGMDEELTLESIFTFDKPSEETLEENPNEDATVVRKI